MNKILRRKPWAFEPHATQIAHHSDWLNIGCGTRTFQGFLNTDKHPGDGVDLQIDLNSLPLPFDDDSFNLILASHVLEHVRDLEPLILDLMRISRDGALWEVHAPVGREALEVIDHVRMVTDITFRNWDPDWPTTSAEVVQMRKDHGTLKILFQWFTRDLRLGPVSAYHFRKYLTCEPPGRKSQLIMILQVGK